MTGRGPLRKPRHHNQNEPSPHFLPGTVLDPHFQNGKCGSTKNTGCPARHSPHFENVDVHILGNENVDPKRMQTRKCGSCTRTTMGGRTPMVGPAVPKPSEQAEKTHNCDRIPSPTTPNLNRMCYESFPRTGSPSVKGSDQALRAKTCGGGTMAWFPCGVHNKLTKVSSGGSPRRAQSWHNEICLAS